MLPSPFAYLPLTPQELLRAYLGIVGIAPQDSYGVQITYGRPLNLLARTSTSRASSGPPAATRCRAPTARTACACTAAHTW